MSYLKSTTASDSMKYPRSAILSKSSPPSQYLPLDHFKKIVSKLESFWFLENQNYEEQ